VGQGRRANAACHRHHRRRDRQVDDLSDNIFKASSPRPGSEYRRAWLAYEVKASATGRGRALDHGRPKMGGFALPSSSTWNEQFEPLNPLWLTQGENLVRFSMPAGLSQPYQIRNVRL